VKLHPVVVAQPRMNLLVGALKPHSCSCRKLTM
jgi:hypothetical protein